MRILIAHHHEMVRRSVAWLLSQEKSWSVAGEAPNSEEVLKQAEELHPDVILLDVSRAEHRWAGDDTSGDVAAS